MKALIIKNIADRKVMYMFMLIIFILELVLGLSSGGTFGLIVYSFITIKTSIHKSYPISLKMHLCSLISMGILVVLSGSILVLMFSLFKPISTYRLFNYISVLFAYCVFEWATTIKIFKFSGNQMLILVLYVVLLVFVLMVLNLYPMERMVYAILVSSVYFAINFLLIYKREKDAYYVEY